MDNSRHQERTRLRTTGVQHSQQCPFGYGYVIIHTYIQQCFYSLYNNYLHLRLQLLCAQRESLLGDFMTVMPDVNLSLLLYWLLQWLL